jgi:hypothetical protein
MTYFIIKVLVSAFIIAGVSELSRRSSFAGALLASLPLTSLLAFVWLYRDTRNTEQIAALSISIFWLVIPSLVLFLTLPMLLRRGFAFYPALGLAALATVFAYVATAALLRNFGVKV